MENMAKCGCLLVNAHNEEQAENARKRQSGELSMYSIHIPHLDIVPEIRWMDEVICSTTQEPKDGAVIAFSQRKDRGACVEVSLYDDHFCNLVAKKEACFLGVVIEFRRDPFEAVGDELTFRKFSRVDQN